MNIKICIIPIRKWLNLIKCLKSKMENPISPLRFYKAGNTATPVACGWAGAAIEVTRSFGQKPQNPQKSSVTDGPTDRWTDLQSRVLSRVARN